MKLIVKSSNKLAYACFCVKIQEPDPCGAKCKEYYI